MWLLGVQGVADFKQQDIGFFVGPRTAICLTVSQTTIFSVIELHGNVDGIPNLEVAMAVAHVVRELIDRKLILHRITAAAARWSDALFVVIIESAQAD